MIIIQNINSQRFTLNGISYFKNYLSQVVNGNVRIINAYDSKLELLRYTPFNQVQLNGVVYASAALLQQNLLPVLYSRSTLGDGSAAENGFVQISPIVTLENPNRVRIPIDPVIPIWSIGGVQYSKNTITTLPIDDATAGHYRIDAVVANSANNFEVIQGQESEGIAVPPTIAYNVVLATYVNVFGDQIAGTSTPVPGGQFITKSSKQYRGVNVQNNNPTQILISHEWTTYIIKVLAGSGEIDGFIGLSVADELFISYAFDGMDVYMKNGASPDAILKHNHGTAPLKFWFNDGQDYILKQHEIIHLKLNLSQGRLELVKGRKDYQYFKANNNTGLAMESGDFFCGIVEGFYIQGIWNGGPIGQLTSFSIATQIPTS